MMRGTSNAADLPSGVKALASTGLRSRSCLSQAKEAQRRERVLPKPARIKISFSYLSL